MSGEVLLLSISWLPLEEVSQDIEELKSELSYGWGVIPAKLTINQTSVTTSLIPKNGSFFVPLKDAIRKPNQIELGDLVQVLLEL